MGNSLAGLRSAGQQAGKLRTLPKAPTHDEAAVLSKIVAQEQARLRDLPSQEEINAKDLPLDQLLSKISSSITPHLLDVSRGAPHPNNNTQQPAQGGPTQSQAPSEGSSRSGVRRGDGTSIQMSAKDRTMPIPEYRPSGLSADQLAQRQGRPRAVVGAQDTDPGRVQVYVLREVLEAKNAAEAQGVPLDLAPFTEAYDADPAKLEQLFKHCAIPLMGRVKTFGHEYAFARPPPWWNPHASKSIFKSEQAVMESSRDPGAQGRQDELPAAFREQTQSTEGPEPAVDKNHENDSGKSAAKPTAAPWAS